MAKLAIVSMMRNPGELLRDFVHYHRNIGFSRFYILFDDPRDPDIEIARSLDDVVAIGVDERVREQWKDLYHYADSAPYVDNTVGARQMLNIEYGTRQAIRDGMEWLLHIDIDELIRVKGNDMQSHVGELVRNGYERANYLNYEGIPVRRDTENYYREVKVFKKPVKLLARQGITRKGTWPGHRRYFNFYVNGKSMTRLDHDTVPLGAHRWKNLSRKTRSVTLFNPCILHYAVCGYSHFRLKYAHRGNFSDRRMHQDLRAGGALLDLDARDAYMAGDEALAERIYRERVMMDHQSIVRLLEAGILKVFDPAQLPLDS